MPAGFIRENSFNGLMFKTQLSEDKVKKIYDSFKEYKTDKDLTLQEIGNQLGVDRSTISNYFKKGFPQEYKEIYDSGIKHLGHKPTIEQRLKHSLALKGKKKPPRSLQHRINLSKSMSLSYIERFGYEKAKAIRAKIIKSNKGKIHHFRNKELWSKNLSSSLKGRSVWNKSKKTGQKPWNKKDFPSNDIIHMYTNENLSPQKIALSLGTSRSVISRILKENHIQMKGFSGFYAGKTLVEKFGEERANLIRSKLSKTLKGRHYSWGDKISLGIKKHYKEHGVSDERRIAVSIMSKRLWQNPIYRSNLIKKHKDYLIKHPEELIRLKEIQHPGNISKIEQKVLNFLREKFKEGEDFYFDKQDITNKTFYRPDFQFPNQKIIIELDGYYKHFTKEGYKKDKIREYYLKKAGWKIYRFNHDIISKDYLFKETKNRILEIIKNG